MQPSPCPYISARFFGSGPQQAFGVRLGRYSDSSPHDTEYPGSEQPEGHRSCGDNPQYVKLHTDDQVHPKETNAQRNPRCRKRQRQPLPGPLRRKP